MDLAIGLNTSIKDLEDLPLRKLYRLIDNYADKMERQQRALKNSRKGAGA